MDQSPEPGDIKADWSKVRPALEEIARANPQSWIPEDIYSECVHGLASYFAAPEGFVIAKITRDDMNGDVSLFIWIAYSYELGGGNVHKYMPYFEKVAVELGCGYLETASPVPELEPYLVNAGWKVKTRVFVKEV